MPYLWNNSMLVPLFVALSCIFTAINADPSSQELNQLKADFYLRLQDYMTQQLNPSLTVWQDTERDLQKACRGWYRRYNDLSAWLEEKKDHQAEFEARAKPFKEKFFALIKKHGGLGLNIPGCEQEKPGVAASTQRGAESKPSQGAKVENAEPTSTAPQQSIAHESKSHHKPANPNAEQAHRLMARLRVVQSRLDRGRSGRRYEREERKLLREYHKLKHSLYSH
jgi:hypothetical protein